MKIPGRLARTPTFFLLALVLLAVGATGQGTPEGLTAVALGGQLVGNILEYVVNPGDLRAEGKDTVTIVYTVPEEAWIAVGFSTEGLMIGSEAVIGFPATGEVVKYGLTSFIQSTGVLPLPEAQQTLIDASITQGDGLTSMRFTKIMEEPGEIPIVIGPNIFMGSVGFDNNFFMHAKRDSFGIELAVAEETDDAVGADAAGGEEEVAPAATTVVIIETRKRSLWKAHGWCAALAWGLCAPLAIGAALLRRWFPDGLWLTIHQGLNIAVGVLTVASFGLAVAAIGSETPAGGSSYHFSSDPFPHRFIGLVVFLLVAFQVLSGLFRPHNPGKGEEKSCTRRFWEVLHRVLGLVLLALAWYQIDSGIGIYQLIFSDSASARLSGIFWGITGSLSAIIVVGFVVTKMTDRADDDDDDDGAWDESVEDA